MATITREIDVLIEELYRTDGKAEIIGGKVVRLMSTGRKPMLAAADIYVSLRSYSRQHRLPGTPFTDGTSFVVNLPHRKSFSPDAGYYVGPDSEMRFFDGAPIFAVEVRSEGDYGPSAEEKIEAKRADYFSAGTQVVWDVDLLSAEAVVKKFVAPNSVNPASVFGRGQTADAEPAVPGWTLNVDDLFDSE